MIKIQISKTLQGKIRKGYPWVFNYQIQNRIPDGSRENLGVIYDHNNRFLAMGLWDPYSDLCFRVLNLGKPREINGYFFPGTLAVSNKNQARTGNSGNNRLSSH